MVSMQGSHVGSNGGYSMFRIVSPFGNTSHALGSTCKVSNMPCRRSYVAGATYMCLEMRMFVSFL